MKNRSVSLPIGMVSRKFFCHRCGTQLDRKPRTRTLRHGDADYKKYSRTGNMRMLGDIEVTEYDFHCPACGTVIGYKEQCVIEYIQKQADRHILSRSEITAASEEATASLERKQKLSGIFWTALCIAAAIVLYFLKSR